MHEVRDIELIETRGIGLQSDPRTHESNSISEEECKALCLIGVQPSGVERDKLRDQRVLQQTENESTILKCHISLISLSENNNIKGG